MSPMIVTKKQLPRRTVLRGFGVALALPFLDGMVPAFASTLVKSPRRLGAIYVPNGMNMGAWTPKGEGADLELTSILQPLVPFRDRVVVVSGLANTGAEQRPGEGSGDHPRSSASYLTGAHCRETEGTDIRNGPSMDQVAAKEFGRETQLTSLELSLESNDLAGACEHGYSCVYNGAISWASAETPLIPETDPRAVFERLFGSSTTTDPQARLARLKMDRSVLDMVTDRLADLRKKLGAGDRQKVAEFADSVRDVERRIQRAEEQSTRELPLVVQPGGVPADYEEYAKTMMDLWALAWQCDLTRVTTFMFAREKSARSYPEIGVSDGHHPISHHQNRPELLEKLAKINTFHMRLFAYLVEKLHATREGDGNLLDQVAIVYGSGMSNSDMHLHRDLPMMVMGGGGGDLKGGRHIRVPADTPLANLHVTVLNKIGVATEGLGDSTGAIAAL